MNEQIQFINALVDKFETREMEERSASRMSNHPSQLDVAHAEVRMQAGYVYRLLIADLISVRNTLIEHHLEEMQGLLSEALPIDPTVDDSAILRLIPRMESTDE